MPKRRKTDQPSPLLFAEAFKRRHLRLFLPKLLEREAEKPIHDTPIAARAREILRHWADLADQGNLNHKETALDAEFLEKIFGDALGYRSVTETPDEYHREKSYSVPGAGTADGALGFFSTGGRNEPQAVIELKGADTDLDHDKPTGRTPVQQCWDYLNGLPGCPWGIVSNYVTIRLYHRDCTPRAYEEFTVADFRDERRCRQFYCIFERGGLLGNKLHGPRTLSLLKHTHERQKEVGDDLYSTYSGHRLELIHHLVREKRLPENEAIRIAQKILDRIIFIAFCEDRGLLPEGLISRTYKEIPPFARAVNPIWKNFKDLFNAVDQGDDSLGIPGYNGGLFSDDPPVDNLDLDDKWTHFFSQVSKYDFRDEVNVDVLGHLFEQSVTELEKLRTVGLFGPLGDQAEGPMMPKSAQRKRFGIYYTPPDFTRLIVENTIGKLVQERVDALDDPHERIRTLRRIKVCDPACGSGAFLIAAYDRLEYTYHDAIRLLRIQKQQEEADGLEWQVADWILADNLHGVDLSQESVEITQLALWIRSARKGRKLSDLSEHIKCGNSLVRDASVDPRALDWPAAFPQVFGRDEPGFDVVIGNPPWERMKLQEREFFSLGSPDIASAVNAADRKRMIAELEGTNAALWKRYQEAKAAAEAALAHIRSSNEFPLTARGDINTYMLFAELARKIVAPHGRVGLLVPSGIATDDTTKDFFADLVENQTLIALYDFENKRGLFSDVHRSFKFSVFLTGGGATRYPAADFVFFAHDIEDLEDRKRHIDLSARDLNLLNPNTRTCPIFRSRADAELTKAIYRRVPILIDRNRREGGNPWGIRFFTMFHQTNDAELFQTAEQLKQAGFRLEGNRWIRRKQVCLPLYEAKMVQAYDHRAASVRVEQDNWMRQGQPEETTLVEHQNPEYVVIPRYWVNEAEIARALAGEVRGWFLGFKDITSATNQRTMIAAMLPYVGVVNSAPLMLTDSKISLRLVCCLLGNLNSFAYDFVARQKVGGLHLNFFIVEQLPTLPPEQYAERCPWEPRQTLEKWISDRVLKLTCTADDMLPLAEAAGFRPGVCRWKENERAEIRAELDAAFFILYGLSRDEIEYALSTFQGVAQEDEREGGRGQTRQLIREALDRLTA
ncbi:MAG TPA: DNA methyltransferase [Phycisphaerae bacterium]|nr:DNA methyltransferase [Phycisphaerae bacterium]